MKSYFFCLMTVMAATVTVTGQTPAQSQPSGITTEQFINQAALSGMKEVAAGKMAMQKAQRPQLKDYGAMMTQDHDKANTELTAIAKSKSITLPSSADTTAVSSGSGSIGARPATDGTQTGLNRAAGTTVNANTTGITEPDTTSGATGVATKTNKSVRTAHTTAKSAVKQKNGQPSPTSTPGSMSDGNDSLKMVTEADITSALKQLYALESTQFDAAYTEMMVADHKNAIALFKQGVQSSDPDIKAFASKHLPTLRSHLQQIQQISETDQNGQQAKPTPAGAGSH